MQFREFFNQVDQTPNYEKSDVINMYYHNPTMSVREISATTGHSVGEIYRIIHDFGGPNRKRPTNHASVFALADSNLSHRLIADLTGYTPRHVRNILKNQ